MSENWSRDEKSLLMYFETCLVDQYGRVEGRRMNTQDLEIAKKFNKKRLIEFGRIKFSHLGKFTGTSKVYTHWVRFSEKAWKLTHQFRKERAERMLERNKRELEKEMTKNR